MLNNVTYDCSKRAKGRRELQELRKRVMRYESAQDLLKNDEFLSVDNFQMESVQN